MVVVVGESDLCALRSAAWNSTTRGFIDVLGSPGRNLGLATAVEREAH